MNLARDGGTNNRKVWSSVKHFLNDTMTKKGQGVNLQEGRKQNT